MTTIINTLIKFLCKHCSVMYLDTFYQACEAFSTVDPYHEKPFYYAKIWSRYKNNLDKFPKT